MGEVDFSLWLAGPTGVFKSELAALAQQFYGSGFDSRHLPGSWMSTANSLEKLLSVATSTVVVIDDFAPPPSFHERRELDQKIDRVVRSIGNGAARNRLNADATFKASRVPRCLPISTAEDIPRGQSLLGRLLILEVARGDISPQHLTMAQGHAARGLFATAMGGFVRHLAAPTRYPQWRNRISHDAREIRGDMAIQGSHARTAEITANIFLAFSWFLQYAQRVNVITATKHEQLVDIIFDALDEVSTRQSRLGTDSNPADRFIDLLRSAIAGKQAHLANRDGSCPENCRGWGWTTEGSTCRAGGTRVGWLLGGHVALNPDAAIKAANNMDGAGAVLTLTSRMLARHLADRGVLVREPNRDELCVRRQIEGRVMKVWLLPRESFGDIREVVDATSEQEVDGGNGGSTGGRVRHG